MNLRFLFNFLDLINNALHSLQQGIRIKRDLSSNIIVHNPEYYRKYVDGVKRYVELVLVADNSVV